MQLSERFFLISILSVGSRFNMTRLQNVLQKKRQLRATFCEALSPLFLIWLLAYGYSMSDVYKFEDTNYAPLSLSIPDEINSVLFTGKF